MLMLSGTTQILGIIGNPIRHTLSPAIQNAAISACNLDYIYVPFAVSTEFLADAVTGLLALGVSGFNVTIPHKTTIMKYMHELDESAISAGAVNTVSVCEGRMTGYNTDGNGFVRSLADDLEYAIGAGTIVVVGAGGVARGAVAALCQNGADKIILTNRSHNKAEKLAEEMTSRYPNTIIEVSLLNEINAYHLSSASLLVNTTSIGMNGERLESLDLAALPKGAKVYDMVYSLVETPLIQDSAANGVMAVNGLGMLAAQGELSFTIWTGKVPPKGLMKNVLQNICYG